MENVCYNSLDYNPGGKLFTSESGLELISVNNDPILILPEIIINKRKIVLTVDLTVPDETFIQIFYKGTLTDDYQESRSVKHRLIKGRSIVQIIIPETRVLGGLRLDPGHLAGHYIIHSIIPG